MSFWASSDAAELAVERRVVEWLSARVSGDMPPLEPLDERTVRCLLRSRLVGLAHGEAAANERIAAEVERSQGRDAIVEDASAWAVSVLHAEGVPCVTLKGPAFAARYWDGVLRGSTDVDLLVAPEDVERAQRALGAAGAIPDASMPDWYQRRWHYHVGFQLTERRCPLELHWSVASSASGTLPVAKMISHAAQVRCQRHELPALDPVWSAVAAAIHAVQHDFALRELADVAFVTASLSRSECADVAREALACRMSAWVYYGLAVSAERLGRPLPREFERLRPGRLVDGPMRWYAARLPLVGLPSWAMQQWGRVIKPLLAGSPRGWLRAIRQTATRQVRLARLVEGARRRF